MRRSVKANPVMWSLLLDPSAAMTWSGRGSINPTAASKRCNSRLNKHHALQRVLGLFSSELERSHSIGLVNHYNGGARDLNVWTLLQIADVDTGAIRAVHADLVIKMLTA
jgi:hypothetical protein